MNRKHHTFRQSRKTIMATAALILLFATVSHAQKTLDQVLSQTVDTTLSLAADASKKEKDKGDKKSVPEPSANILLLLGLGVISLGGYCVERRQRMAYATMSEQGPPPGVKNSGLRRRTSSAHCSADVALWTKRTTRSWGRIPS
jgi:hypothetical protein